MERCVPPVDDVLLFKSFHDSCRFRSRIDGDGSIRSTVRLGGVEPGDVPWRKTSLTVGTCRFLCFEVRPRNIAHSSSKRTSAKESIVS
jgi:hypothetical protein